MSLLSRTRIAAVSVAAGLLVTACGGAAATNNTTNAGGVTNVVNAQQAEVTAEELRITLERQLGQHALLAIEAMRAGVAGQEHFDAAAGALGKNTDDLTESIRLVYGDEGAEKFNELWTNHIGFFVDYTVGLAEGDKDKQQKAKKRLDQYRQDFGAFLEGATEGELPQNAVADLLQAHVDQLIGQVEAYNDEDYEKAASTTREAYAHMFATAKGLANAIVSTQDGFEGSVEGQAVDLRSSLGQLLGEHAQVAMQAMRAGVSGQDDFEAIAGALNENTKDLTAAISSVFGEEGGQAFMKMWADHIDFFVQYTVGLAEGDQQKQDDALKRLEQYQQDFSNFLDTASDGSIPADVVAKGLQAHVDQLTSQVKQFNDGDFEGAFSSADEAYNHMYDTAKALSAGIVAFMGGEMPSGGVETGAGGTAK
ncbi:copper amine oxidase [Haloechinothrix halophila]|uniref:copper amine oxidase n=1 Tax=Haloechinothrix halophila TaxID=1069073 RepID=UPI0012FCA875|nr:copper amine oxidase [Haloechinothrix halophila]